MNTKTVKMTPVAMYNAFQSASASTQDPRFSFTWRSVDKNMHAPHVVLWVAIYTFAHGLPPSWL
jgi:hypothetical protein